VFSKLLHINRFYEALAELYQDTSKTVPYLQICNIVKVSTVLKLMTMISLAWSRCDVKSRNEANNLEI
jgi:flagellin-specific chaperone FliS